MHKLTKENIGSINQFCKHVHYAQSVTISQKLALSHIAEYIHVHVKVAIVTAVILRLQLQ